jgi:hypothetical protein
VKFRGWFARRLKMGARPIAALCVKQSSLPSRVNKRSQAATKISSEDRPTHVAHAPSSLSTVIRAASAAAENAAAFSIATRAHPLVPQRVAVLVSSAKRDRQHRRSAVQFSGLKGDNSDPRRCPPFCPPCPSARAAIN